LGLGTDVQLSYSSAEAHKQKNMLTRSTRCLKLEIVYVHISNLHMPLLFLFSPGDKINSPEQAKIETIVETETMDTIENDIADHEETSDHSGKVYVLLY
jgi:hypothetical protein